jgi:hypothetical protein
MISIIKVNLPNYFFNQTDYEDIINKLNNSNLFKYAGKSRIDNREMYNFNLEQCERIRKIYKIRFDKNIELLDDVLDNKNKRFEKFTFSEL